MKEKKFKIIILGIILIVLSVVIYTRMTIPQTDDDNKIIVDIENEDNGTTSGEGADGLILSEKDATNLALEQIDISQFNISIIEGIKEIEEEKYYLFDIINKTGPSFAMQLAINVHSGEMLAHDPNNGELLPMTEFPIETPIAQEQDWNGTFVPGVNKKANPNVKIELRQGDTNSFEFDVVRPGEEDTIVLQGIGRISGAMATYEDEEGFNLIFTKSDELLKIKELGVNPLKDEGDIIEGTYAIEIEKDQ